MTVLPGSQDESQALIAFYSLIFPGKRPRCVQVRNMPEHVVKGLDDLNNKALGLEGTGKECDMDFAISSTGMGPFFPPNILEKQFPKCQS